MPASPELLRSVEILKRRIGAELRGRLSYCDAATAHEWCERWTRVRSELVVAEPELSYLPLRDLPKPTEWSGHSGKYVKHADLRRVFNDLLDAYEVLTHPTRRSPQLTIDREGIFLAGQPFDAMLAVTSIFRAAKKSIVVVDGYVSDRTLAILSTKGDTIAASILTKSAPPAFVTAAQAFKLQHSGAPLEVRTSSVFHDRFIVIDDTDVFHLGTSIKDAARTNTFMFSRIEEPPVIDAFKKHFAASWLAATQVAL